MSVTPLYGDAVELWHDFFAVDADNGIIVYSTDEDSPDESRQTQRRIRELLGLPETSEESEATEDFEYPEDDLEW